MRWVKAGRPGSAQRGLFLHLMGVQFPCALVHPKLWQTSSQRLLWLRWVMGWAVFCSGIREKIGKGREKEKATSPEWIQQTGLKQLVWTWRVKTKTSDSSEMFLWPWAWSSGPLLEIVYSCKPVEFRVSPALGYCCSHVRTLYILLPSQLESDVDTGSRSFILFSGTHPFWTLNVYFQIFFTFPAWEHFT